MVVSGTSDEYSHGPMRSTIEILCINNFTVCVCECVCESMCAYGSHTNPIIPYTNVLFSIPIFSFNGYGSKLWVSKLHYSKLSKFYCVLLFTYFYVL